MTATYDSTATPTISAAEVDTLLNPPLAGDTGRDSALAYLGRLLPFVHLPGTDEYAAAVAPWNVAVGPRPVAVVEARNAADVADAVRFAGRHRLQVAVQATGHGIASDMDGLLLISTKRLTGLFIDSSDGLAHAEAGVTWEQVLEAGAPHGLAGLCGSAPHVGVVGYSTGGGVGPLARTLGLASDRVRAFDVVTGDGVARRASATENADLFWALRGGKGLTGVITAVEFDLARVADIYAGALYFGADDVEAVVERWAGWSAGLPREASTSVAILRLPPLPGVPEPLAGRVTAAVRFAWTGDANAGARVLAPMREVAVPVLDAVTAMPYRALGAIHADPVDPMPTHEEHRLLGSFDSAAAAALLRAAGPDSECPQVMVEVRQLGGAIEDGAPSAYDMRGAACSLLMIGLGVPPFVEAVAAHADATSDALAPWTVDGGLPNFAPRSGRAWLEKTYRPDTIARLAKVSRRYDPAGVIAGTEHLT